MNIDVNYLANVIAGLHVEMAAQLAASKEKDARIAALEAQLKEKAPEGALPAGTQMAPRLIHSEA